MRRGLLAWSKAEVPQGILDDRVARCQAAIADADMNGLLIYTNFPRPAAVSYLTHFVPYWSQGALLVLPDGAPSLFVSLSKRVGGWIEETSHIAEVICTPRLGADIAGFLNERSGAPGTLGVLELTRLPGGIATPLSAALDGTGLIDASDLFRSIRHPADDAELAVSERAGDMARQAFDAIGTPSSTAPLVAAMDGTVRGMGAEEVHVMIAPNLNEDTRLIRPEGNLPLGERFAVQISVAYKAHWIRTTRTLARDGASTDAPDGFAGALARNWREMDLASALQQAIPDAPLRSWRAELNSGSNPLSLIQSERDRGSGIPPGSVVSVTATYDGAEGPVLIGTPLVAPSAADQARP